ncbi:MAG: MBL fold metallo-hydrolase [Anaerolineae bacterium]|nr:MBL fold metallo-hydrolase [Anaerolineae bacterium]
MELLQLSESVCQLRGGTNIGLVVDGRRALVIDAGLDRDAGRRIARAARQLGVEIVAVAITHAHADHFGGAAEVKRRTGALVYAPAFEAAIIENPELEGYYLFSGARPPIELRHKFILAPGCHVDGQVEAGEQEIAGFHVEAIPMPGHAQNQMMFGVGDICFAGDTFFHDSVLDKYGIPFYVDVAQADESLQRLAALAERFSRFVPGHGPAVADVVPLVESNRERIRTICDHVRVALGDVAEVGDILASVAKAMRVSISAPAIYYLTLTTIHACLSALQAAGEAAVAVEENRAVWRLTSQS